MAEIDQTIQLPQKIAKILDETKTSNATHNRKLKELSNLSFSPHFFASFCKALTPLFVFQRRTASADRVIRFVSTFATARDPKICTQNDAFLENLLRFLLSAVTSSNKTARFRSCQIISEVIMRLPDDAEVSDDLWDQVIDNMLIRMGDKIPIIRTFAIRALSRFVNDDNSDILESFLQTLDSEQIADVRKTIVLSLPPSNATSAVIIGCTLDVSENVRKAAYLVLANKFPLQSLSIKLRTLILQRGLSDRSPAVVKECLKLMIDEWLTKSCKGDPVELLKHLDVETYESIGISVMKALLRAGMVKLDGSRRIQQFQQSSNDDAADLVCNPITELLEPEAGLYWRVVCQDLHSVAQAKGSDAAATMGTEAAVYAAEASDSNDLLEKVLPTSVSEYVDFVQAHITAGPNYRFVSRQLLLLGALLDFSDTTIRRTASTFVQDLLRRPVDYEMDSDGNKLVIGDGINFGGDRDWASAVAGLIMRVHAANGEFEEVLLGVVEELARPCRERTANFMEWMHCLAVIGLLLENTKSFRCFQGKAIEPIELLNSLLLPAVKHINLDVQIVAIRCLGLYGLLEKKLSDELVKQLGRSFLNGPSPISILAGKALIDLVMWHGPEDVGQAIGKDFVSQAQDNELHFTPDPDFCNNNSDSNVEVLKLLYVGLGNHFSVKSSEIMENESVQAALGEGFAKILLLSENYLSLPASLHSLILAKLIGLYFSEEKLELQRLKQCLSVFFEHYPSLSAYNKKHLSGAFVPVVRAMWPGIDGYQGGSSAMISALRKRAVQASRFMLQMMKSVLYQREVGNNEDDLSKDCDGSIENSDEFETGEEGLAIRVTTEVVGFPSKKTPAVKSYISALCKIIVLLHFRASEQGAIKLMRILLNHAAEVVTYDKELVKELTSMAKNLKALDRNPDEELSREQANVILERLGVNYNVDEDHSSEIPPTPVSRPTQQTRVRRRVRQEETSSDEEESPTSVVPSAVCLSSMRSQRASKTAAITKISTSRAVQIIGDDIEEAEDSELTSEEESDDSDSSIQ